MSEPIKRKAKGDKVEIQLAVREGGGKSILCVHGLTANCRCWDTIADSLSPAHRVLAMDIRGRGLSDKPDSGYSVLQHCKDIECLLDDLSLKKVTLMGHSLGAFISVKFGALYPERVEKIVLVDGGGKLSEEQMGKVLSGIKPSLDRLGQVLPSFDEYRDLLMKAPFNNPWNEALDIYYRYEVEDVEGGIRSRVQPEHMQEEIANLGQFDVSETYSEIACPVLILRATDGMLAEDDCLLPEDVVKNMLSKIPIAKRVDISGSNHYSIMFNSNETRDRALRSFLAE